MTKGDKNSNAIAVSNLGGYSFICIENRLIQRVTASDISLERFYHSIKVTHQHYDPDLFLTLSKMVLFEQNCFKVTRLIAGVEFCRGEHRRLILAFTARINRQSILQCLSMGQWFDSQVPTFCLFARLNI